MEKETWSAVGQTEGEGGSGRHSYTSSLKLQLAELVKKFALTAGLMMLPAALLLTLDTGRSVTEILTACVIPAAVFAVYWAFWKCHIRIEVSEAGVSFYRGKRQYQALALDMDFTPAVVKKTMNGIFYGTDRELRLPYKKNRYKKISCHCLSGKDFSSLLEDINSLRNEGSLCVAPAGSRNEQEGKAACKEETFPTAAFRPQESDCHHFDFCLPKERMTAGERKRLRPILLCQAALLLLIAIGSVVFSFRNPAGQAQFLRFMAFVLVLLFTLFFFTTGRRYRSFSDKLPSRIALTDSGVRIDEKLFTAADLQEITMTPPNYRETRNGYSFGRRLILGTASGKKKYQLGCTQIAPVETVYEEYEELLAALRDWCGVHKVPFREESE